MNKEQAQALGIVTKQRYYPVRTDLAVKPIHRGAGLALLRVNPKDASVSVPRKRSGFKTTMRHARVKGLAGRKAHPSVQPAVHHRKGSKRSRYIANLLTEARWIAKHKGIE